MKDEKWHVLIMREENLNKSADDGENETTLLDMIDGITMVGERKWWLREIITIKMDENFLNITHLM